MVMARLAEVYKERLAWIGQIFKELGFAGDEFEMRTRLFVCYHSWERIMFPGQTKTRAKRLIKRQVELLVRL